MTPYFTGMCVLRRNDASCLLSRELCSSLSRKWSSPAVGPARLSKLSVSGYENCSTRPVVRSHLWLLLLWIVQPAYVLAAPPATQPGLPADLQPLLKGLSAEDWLTREQAQSQLEQ